MIVLCSSEHGVPLCSFSKQTGRLSTLCLCLTLRVLSKVKLDLVYTKRKAVPWDLVDHDIVKTLKNIHRYLVA